MALVSLKNVTFAYPNTLKNTLEDITLTIEEGDFVVIAGSSGCGKTTLIRQLKSELAPHGTLSGEILYDNVPLTSLDPKREASEIGYVMQNPQNQIVTDKVWHELAFGLENLGYPSEKIRLRVCEMASFFGMNDLFDKNTSELSGGQMQLLNLASVMAMQPRLLILDEPTSQLDPIAASDFIATLKKLNKDMGITIILIEHRLEEVFSFADKVLILDNGKMQFYASPQEVGKQLRNQKSHKLSLALPTPLRVFQSLDIEGECPLTVRDGRRFLSNYFTFAEKELESNENYSKNVVFELKDVWFRYEKNEPDVLKGIFLRAFEGEMLSIVGANGAGKTTMLSVLSRLLKPYRGTVKLNNKNISSYKSQELYYNHLAVLPQNPQTLFLMDTVLDDLKEVCHIMKYDEQTTIRKIEEVSSLLEIQSIMETHPYDLSGGEQQKAALAKILLLNPTVLLLDEPTKGIDAFAKQSLALILRKLANNGATIIIVTHDIEFSACYTDRCALFFNGEIVSQGKPNWFYCNNSFYTTVANKMSRHIFSNAVTCEDVIELCKKSQKEKDSF